MNNYLTTYNRIECVENSIHNNEILKIFGNSYDIEKRDKISKEYSYIYSEEYMVCARINYSHIEIDLKNGIDDIDMLFQQKPYPIIIENENFRYNLLGSVIHVSGENYKDGYNKLIIAISFHKKENNE